jgi:hypothetical protein
VSHSSARGASFAVALLFALAIAGDLLWMPIQVNDALGEILAAHDTSSVAAAFTGSIGTDAYLRPARIAQIKALVDAADGRHYWAIFRGFHATLLVAAIVLFTGALRVRTAIEAGAAAVALSVLVGLHTFRGLVQEAFPINHFLEMAVAALIVVNLSRSAPAIWKDVAAVVTLAIALLTLESGLLVWVAVVTCWVLGWRGITGRGVAIMTLLVGGYLALRFFYLDTGVPSLAERSSGYLFEMLDPPALQARFAAQPEWFYAYNVAASALSVLLSEPRAGVFAATAAAMTGDVPPRILLWIVTSVPTTLFIGWSLARRVRQNAGLDDHTRLLILFVVLLAANATLSFAYAKDEIMSVAGVFYGIAAFVAIGDALRFATGTARPATALVLAALLLLASAWSLRAVGVHYLLRAQAVKHQMDWAVLPHNWKREGRWPQDPAKQALILQLRREAIAPTLPNARLGRPEWPDLLWID